MYLVIGSEKAVLIDTGYGIGDLLGYVRGITDLPLTVICTHGHVDHIGGSGQFENVYLSELDWKLAEEHGRVDMRLSYYGDRNVQKSYIIPPRTSPYTPLYDGKKFDLGTEILEMVSCPGHTAGSMCVLFQKQKFLLLGDACNSFTFLFLEGALDIPGYKKGLKHLQNACKGRVWEVLFSHRHNFGDSSIIAEMIDLCDNVLDGTDDHIPARISNTDVYIAKEIDEKNRRTDQGTANVVYRQMYIKVAAEE